ncbi:exo-alpha-sialidase, partial [Candidatus Sumerlaeota bacterium]|nr:exo-alpha-sialidase [Candidatus Sumerlaeota bacterium]
IFWADEQHRTLRMLVRGSTPVGKVCTATSTDKGLTWSAASPIDALPNPNSAVDAVRLKDGRIALAHNDLAEGKNRLALSLSTDGGATWKKAFDIENHADGEYLYPSIIQDSEGMIQAVYTWQKQKIGYAIIDPNKF